VAESTQLGRLRITLVKGLRGKREDHRATVRGLGLKWRSHTVELEDTPQVRGMINKVGYMLRVSAGAQGQG
jgi:large subunit ribosomal protein L30